jgi:hypothetical protein
MDTFSSQYLFNMRNTSSADNWSRLLTSAMPDQSLDSETVRSDDFITHHACHYLNGPDQCRLSRGVLYSFGEVHIMMGGG